MNREIISYIAYLIGLEKTEDECLKTAKANTENIFSSEKSTNQFVRNQVQLKKNW